MYLIAGGLEKIPASKIEKDEDFIKVYDENGVVSRIFQGIPDFSKFSRLRVASLRQRSLIS